tara:strand:- start:332 stop:1069 length:738 start_codon:yes stop_codon:yes gene_type:complete
VNKKIIWQFVRMQKTAGASFLEHLREQFPPETVCPHHFEFQLRNDPHASDYQLYHGHMSAKGLENYVTIDRHIFLMRDPAERLRSCYYYWLDNAEPNANSTFFRKILHMSFTDFLTDEDPLFRNTVFNAQARLLAGGMFGPDNDTRTNIIGPDLVLDEIVSAAKKTIDDAYFVGITEMLDHSVRRLLTKMGRAEPEFVRRINVGKLRAKAEETSAVIQDLITKNTQLDQEVYDYALAKFRGSDTE